MEELAKAITGLEEEKAVGLVEKALESGKAPLEVLAVCQDGMSAVGEMFEKNQYYLSELIYSGAIFKRLSDLITLAMKGAAPAQTRGSVVIGTIAGDVHDLGKNIVVMLLKGAGYDVHDLGVDVPPERFIEEVKKTGAGVVGISALLTTSFPGMKEVVDILGKEGLRDSVRIMIGGGVVDERSRDFVGADFQSRNGYSAVNYCNEFFKSE